MVPVPVTLRRSDDQSLQRNGYSRWRSMLKAHPRRARAEIIHDAPYE
jgi:hypothetical protein